jgi:hypothetical protein
MDQHSRDDDEYARLYLGCCVAADKNVLTDAMHARTEA